MNVALHLLWPTWSMFNAYPSQWLWKSMPCSQSVYLPIWPTASLHNSNNHWHREMWHGERKKLGREDHSLPCGGPFGVVHSCPTFAIMLLGGREAASCSQSSHCGALTSGVQRAALITTHHTQHTSLVRTLWIHWWSACTHTRPGGRPFWNEPRRLIHLGRVQIEHA